MRAAWRTRACAAGLCVGAQVFLAGCAVGMPLALSGTWLAALPALLFGAWLTLRCRRMPAQPEHEQTGGRTRARYLLLFAVLLASAAFALLSMTGFATQTLAQQARSLWLEAAALVAVTLCALSGSAGAARVCFALRYILPALVLGLSLAALPVRMPVGLFPILGAGAAPLGLSALGMLFGAAPALMLMLPMQELSGIPSCDRCMPDAAFFLRRVLAGALAGAFLLFLTCVCTTYESIERSSEWGARLRMAAGNQPHEGMLQMALTLAKLLAMLLLAVNMLCAAQQALSLAIPHLHSRPASVLLCSAALAAVLLVQVVFGDGPVLLGAPAIAPAAALSALLPARRKQA